MGAMMSVLKALCFMVMEPSLLQRLAVGGWWLVVGDWWFVGWWLAGGRLPSLALVPVFPLPGVLSPVPQCSSPVAAATAAVRPRPPDRCRLRARWLAVGGIWQWLMVGGWWWLVAVGGWRLVVPGGCP